MEHNYGEETAGAELPASATPDRDLATINTQTRRLVEYSLAVACALAVWCAWVDVLPALGILNVDGLAIDHGHGVPEDDRTADGRNCRSIEQLRRRNAARSSWPICCLAVMILATTVIAAKNIPGLLEMAVLQHLALGRRRALRRRHGLPLPDHHCRPACSVSASWASAGRRSNGSWPPWAWDWASACRKSSPISSPA